MCRHCISIGLIATRLHVKLRATCHLNPSSDCTMCASRGLKYPNSCLLASPGGRVAGLTSQDRPESWVEFRGPLAGRKPPYWQGKHITGHTKMSCNKENLKILADGLISGAGIPPSVKFDMSQFCDGGRGSVNFCGTVGCAVGHGPFFGLAKSSHMNWRQYSQATFGPLTSRQWSYLFDGYWADTIYNNREDTGHRILHFLQNDCSVPDEFDPDLGTDESDPHLDHTYKKYW